LSQTIENIKTEIAKVLVGQEKMIEGLLAGLLCRGHILLEGVPGLAKTTAVNALAKTLGLDFKRVQFTPDLLPSDIIGTEIYDPSNNTFKIKQGPIFTNLLLADEINRAPAKVQSALLEAMQEKQVSIGNKTFTLPELFLVLATQNPIEQEGTYPLPEAQIDRFMLKVIIDYPSIEEELRILRTVDNQSQQQVMPVASPKDIFSARKVISSIYVDEKIEQYIVSLVYATRDPKRFNVDLENYIETGASPRATINLKLVAATLAFLAGRGYVTPDDVKRAAINVMRHRLRISYEAEAEGITSEDIIRKVLDTVPVP